MKKISNEYLPESDGPGTQTARSLDIEQYSIPDQLDHRWAEFVNCSKRIASMGPFLLKELPPHHRAVALDAAMGTGCEVQYLLRHCQRVVGNEINAELRTIARKRIGNDHDGLELASILWQDLGTHFSAGEFDIGLLLGNSFCLIAEHNQRRRIAEACRQIIKPGGAFIIDERNFPYLLNNRDRILREGFRYTRQVVYCGKRISGYPVTIERARIRFAFEDILTKRILGYRTMYPLGPGDIKELFCESGFSHVDEYSDLKPIMDRTADFYTYVFR